MQKVKISLDYNCYPMWIYDENGELVDNDLVEELKGEKEIDEMLLEIQRIYDSLFVDDGVAFEYKGFSNIKQKTAYKQIVESALFLIKVKLDGKYIIVNEIDIK